MKQPSSYEQFFETFVAALNTLVHERNFQPPILLVMVSANQNLVFCRYTAATEHDGLECEVLVNRDVADGYTFPIRLIFLDGASGETALMVIKDKKQQRFNIQTSYPFPTS